MVMHIITMMIIDRWILLLFKKILPRNLLPCFSAFLEALAPFPAQNIPLQPMTMTSASIAANHTMDAADDDHHHDQ